MSNWDAISEEIKKKTAGNSAFVKLEDDGDKFIGIPCGDPEPRSVVWTGNGYAEEGTKEFKKLTDNGANTTVRIKCRFFVLAEGNGDDVSPLETPRFKEWEFGVKAYTSLSKAIKKYGMDETTLPFSFMKRSLEIERNGAKNDNKTTYAIMVDEEVDDSIIALMKAAKYPKKFGGNQDDDGPSGDGDDSDFNDKPARSKKTEAKAEVKAAKSEPETKKAEVAVDGPISEAVSKEIGNRLKALPNVNVREVAAEYLGGLGVTKISFIPAAREAEAMTALEAIEAKYNPAAAKEEDPFG